MDKFCPCVLIRLIFDQLAWIQYVHENEGTETNLWHKLICIAWRAIQLPLVLVDGRRHQLLGARPALYTELGYICLCQNSKEPIANTELSLFLYLQCFTLYLYFFNVPLYFVRA